ncbi:CpmK protein [Cronobacter sakazakii]|nr:CpmK protein [Cronobacter sakazakii]EJC1183846.1 CpmK protein [Cronobacter sakazakii]EJC1244033.1 CpmK protein [Cronobacter sakazakii]EJC2074638.1 CpmK protein [Cronobacter sakazakii]EKK7729353.1 CpmK protein [Cronobacter sakazakii]
MKRRAALAMLLISTSSMAQQVAPYRALLQQALNARSLCLGETAWPVTSRDGADAWLHARMAALVDAGLVVSRREGSQKTWALTPKGRAEFHRHHDFCYGKMRVKTLEVKPQRDGIQATFTYDIPALPQWAKTPALRMADSELDNLISGIDKVHYQAIFIRGDNGKFRLDRGPEPLDLLY